MSFQAPKGVSEYVPPRGVLMLRAREAFAQSAQRAGYGYMESAVFEDTRCSSAVWASPATSSPRRCTPSRTRAARYHAAAGVHRRAAARALEHGLHQGSLPVKIWYWAAFRYERPQAGRYRHFSSSAPEALGAEDPALDAELIAVAGDAYASLGLRAAPGCCSTRSATRSAARPTARRCRSSCAASTWTKRPGSGSRSIRCGSWTTSGPRSGAGRRRPGDRRLPVRGLQGALRRGARLPAHAAGIELDRGPPRLVRGLDYYTRTTFEFVHDGSRRAVRASAAAAATTGCPRRSAAAAASARLGARRGPDRAGDARPKDSRADQQRDAGVRRSARRRGPPAMLSR